jgi:hypothetical protein
VPFETYISKITLHRQIAQTNTKEGFASLKVCGLSEAPTRFLSFPIPCTSCFALAFTSISIWPISTLKDLFYDVSIVFNCTAPGLDNIEQQLTGIMINTTLSCLQNLHVQAMILRWPGSQECPS